MYIILIFLLIYLLFMSLILPKSKNVGKIFLILVMLFLTVMIGFRFDVGIDYLSYYSKFKYYWNSFNNDPLFTTLNFIVHSLNGDFYWVMLISIFITNFFITMYVIKMKWPPLMIVVSIIIYVTTNLFLYTNGVRQGIAVALVLYATSFIDEKKFKQFFIYIILASLFHFSALFTLVLYFIKFKIRTMNYIVIIVISYLMVWTGIINDFLKVIVQFIPKYDFYLETNLLDFGEVNILSLGVLLKVVISIVLISFYKEEKHKNIVTFYQIGVVLNILSLATFMIGRIGYYFYIFDMIAIPYILYLNRKNSNFSILLVIIVVSYLLILVKMLIITPQEGNLIYKWYFNFN